MKKIHLFILLFTSTLLKVSAQSADKNYVMTVVPVAPVTSEAALDALSDSLKNSEILYYDGMGRPLQSLALKASPLGRDVVQSFLYDDLGRSPKALLPYTVAGNGDFRKQAASEQSSFWSLQPGIVHTTFPFAETEYEASPLGRVLRQGKAGEYYQLSGTHTVGTTFRPNGANEVRLWRVPDDGSFPYTVGFYPEGTVSVTSLKDEHGIEALEYKDQEGKVVLTKRQAEGGGWAETLYLYDCFGLLRYSVDPEGLKRLEANAWAFNNDILDNYCFSYRYDENRRLIEKKAPSVPAEEYVYDEADRLVCSRDALLKAKNQWRFVKYTFQGRIAFTGMCTDAQHATRQSMQEFVNTQTTLLEEPAASPTGYSQQTLPKTNLDVRQVFFYDDYDFDRNGSPDVSPMARPDFETPDAYPRMRLTGLRTKVLGANLWLSETYFYDEKGQLLQARSTDHTAGERILTSRFAFTGQVPERELLYIKQNDTTLLRQRFEYDRLLRLVRTYETLNAEPELLVSELSYNELGQAERKKLHSTDGGQSFLQTTDFAYDLQGRLTKINETDLSQSDDLFGAEFFYETPPEALKAEGRYDGNLAAQVRVSKHDPVQRAFAYTYDVQDRVKATDYAASYEKGYGLFDQEQGRYKTEGISYDPAGNILSMTSYGKTLKDIYDKTDQLSYAYKGHRLMAVNDAAEWSGINDFQDNGSIGSTDNPEYLYDALGNLTLDKNKGLTMTYNDLGLPETVTRGMLSVKYLYDASGNRLRKETFLGGQLQETTDYLAGMEYRNGSLRLLSGAEGTVYVDEKQKAYRRYHFTDRLGNVCLSWQAGYTADTTLLCTMEEGKDEEGKEYPQFLNVSETRNEKMAYEGKASAMLEAQEGPSVSIPAEAGTRIRASVYALFNPDGNQFLNEGNGLVIVDSPAVSRNSGRRKNKKKRLSLGLFTQRRPTLEGREEKKTPYVGIGLGLDLKNKEPEPQKLEPNLWPQASLRFVLTDEKENVLKELGKAVYSEGVWHKLELSDTVKQKGFVRVYVDNQSLIPVWFDSLSIQVQPPTVAEVVQENYYSAFGNEIADLAYYKTDTLDYLFNAQSYEKETGLYHYFARQYDPTIGRWNNVDPLAEEYPDLTPYDFVGGNPVNNIDPLGMDYYKSDDGAVIWINSHEPQIKQDGVKYTNVGSIYIQYGEGYVAINYGPGTKPLIIESALLTFEKQSQPQHKYQPQDNGWMSKGLRDLWNSWFMRKIIPDFITVGAGYNGIVGIGAGTSIELNWVMRGPDASIKPVVTLTQSIGVAYSVDATINVGGANYIGPVDDIRKDMLETKIKQGDVTIWGSVGAAEGGKIGVTGTVTPAGNSVIIGRYINIGAGLPLGPLPINGAGGVSNTYRIFKK